MEIASGSKPKLMTCYGNLEFLSTLRGSELTGAEQLLTVLSGSEESAKRGTREGRISATAAAATVDPVVQTPDSKPLRLNSKGVSDRLQLDWLR
jgi:hypothetical protein